MSMSPLLARIKKCSELDVAQKVVFLRLDLNVPLSPPDGNGVCTIEDENRIIEALPTIRLLLEKQARLVVASHLGRPKGKKAAEFSLEPVAKRLAELLDQDVTLADDCVGEGIELMAQSLKSGQILLLENLRFHSGEEKNDQQFASQLARLADVFVMDAFGAAHRAHASTDQLPRMMPVRAIGPLMEREIEFLDHLLREPQKPFYLVLGGAKVSDKIQTISSLMKVVDGILVGGAMEFAFQKSLGHSIPEGAKAPSPEDIEAAGKILREAKRKEIPILLPVDRVDSFDVGPETLEKFSRFIAQAKTIFWNGPLGWFEKPDYAKGTFEFARVLSELSAVKVVGGGDTVSAVKQSGYAEKFEHLSTGGGAVLEFLEGHSLPGIEALK